MKKRMKQLENSYKSQDTKISNALKVSYLTNRKHKLLKKYGWYRDASMRMWINPRTGDRVTIHEIHWLSYRGLSYKLKNHCLGKPPCPFQFP